ncbi:hypothetical protein [Pseudooctadecabacter jejudonensis]|nr:hypothetical protein [Pseudooctadecabacter jejudonensis]
MKIYVMGAATLALAACGAAPAPQSTATNTTALAAPFTVPMDPGQIRCSDLSNPAAATAATDWALGRARAAVLSGTSAAAPTDVDMRAELMAACANAASSTVRQATTG